MSDSVYLIHDSSLTLLVCFVTLSRMFRLRPSCKVPPFSHFSETKAPLTAITSERLTRWKLSVEMTPHSVWNQSLTVWIEPLLCRIKHFLSWRRIILLPCKTATATKTHNFVQTNFKPNLGKPPTNSFEPERRKRKHSATRTMSFSV